MIKENPNLLVNRFSKDKHKILSLYKQGKSIYFLSKIYNLNKSSMRKLLKTWGVIFNNKPFNKNYKFDKSFFKKVDTHEKAYWLGFIYADGNIFQNKLQFTIKDANHLDHLKSAMKADHKVSELNYKSKVYRFSISSKELINDLNNLGVKERKSLTLSFPTEDMVPEKFLGSFMLGYFDGDGSIVIYKSKTGNPKWNFSIIATKDFCEKYNKILSKKCDLFESKITKYKRIPDKDIWEVHLCGVYSNRLNRIYQFLYKNINFGLSRKKERFLDVIDNNPKETYTSKYYGVSKSFDKWLVQLQIKGKMHRGGRFETEEKAARHFDQLIKQHKMDIRFLNFPDE